MLLLLLAGSFAHAKSCSVDHRPLNEAEVAEERGESARALKLFRELATREPAELRWRERMIRAQVDDGKLDGAYGEAQRLLAANPDRADALLAMSEVSERRGDYAEAMAAVSKALAADSCNARVVLELGRLQSMAGHRLLAQRAFAAAHSLAPSSFAAAQLWASTRDLAERTTAFAGLPAAFPYLTAEQKTASELAAAWAALVSSHPCTVVPAKEASLVALTDLDINNPIDTPAMALPVTVNGHREELELLSYRHAVTVSRSAAQAMGLPRDSSDFRLGHERPQIYLTHISSLRVGSVEYRNCPATVINEQFDVHAHGSIGIGFLADFSITVDLGERKLRLASLPELEGGSAAAKAWSHAAMGGPEVSSIAVDEVASEPGVPIEKLKWMHAFLGNREIGVSAQIGPDTERLLYLDFSSRHSEVLPAIAQAATRVAKDPSLPPRYKDALKGSPFCIRLGETVLPVSSWPEETALLIPGALGHDLLQHSRITTDFRDSLITVQHSAQ